jgi:hypothetical protein
LSINLSGHLLHSVFWADIGPKAANPEGALAVDIDKQFGPLDKLKPVPPLGIRDALEQKRRAIWSNQDRNKVIARAAIMVADGQASPSIRPGANVAVLVESPEHGRALAGFLEGWPLRERRPERWGKTRDDSEIPARSIVTYARARQLGILDVDVLVRADGGGWPLPSIGFPRLADGIGADVILVDLDDNGDARQASDTRNRLADYRGRGWKVASFPVRAASEKVSINPIQGREAADRKLILPRPGLIAQPG